MQAILAKGFGNSEQAVLQMVHCGSPDGVTPPLRPLA
jgi:hypothetical protein